MAKFELRLATRQNLMQQLSPGRKRGSMVEAASGQLKLKAAAQTIVMLAEPFIGARTPVPKLEGERSVPKMKAVEVREPKGPLQLMQRDVPSPGAGQVLIKVQACGICHSDIFTKKGLWPGLNYPCVPGHENCRILWLSAPQPMIEEFPLERAAEAYDRMMSGAARFRVVLKPS